MNDEDIFWVILISFIIGACVGGCAIHWANESDWEESAIEAGVGKYNETTAKFEWIVPKKELDN